jgi:aromatic ring hydroxylase-like protein
VPELEHADADAARKEAGDRILALSNIENEALGIEIGSRYASPIVCAEDGKEPAYELLTYAPTTWPGARLPSVFLEDGTAVYDLLGQGFTLICFGDIDEKIWHAETESCGVPCDILKIDEPAVRAIYERDYLLVRPDQHVSWRGDKLPESPSELWAQVTGRNV